MDTLIKIGDVVELYIAEASGQAPSDISTSCIVISEYQINYRIKHWEYFFSNRWTIVRAYITFDVRNCYQLLIGDRKVWVGELEDVINAQRT